MHHGYECKGNKDTALLPTALYIDIKLAAESRLPTSRVRSWHAFFPIMVSKLRRRPIELEGKDRPAASSTHNSTTQLS